MSDYTVDDYGWKSEALARSSQENVHKILGLLKTHGCRSILDLGCGNGSLTAILAENGYDVTGCDNDGNGIAIAQKTFSSVPFFQSSIYDAPDDKLREKYDCVISAEVIEHLFLPDKLLEYANFALKPGGLLILTCPYHGYIKNLIISILGAWDFQHTSLWTGGHIKFWSRKTLSVLLSRNQFDMVYFSGGGRPIPYLWKSMIIGAKTISHSRNTRP